MSMKNRKNGAVLARAAVLGLGAASAYVLAQGAAQPTPAERAIEYRQALFKVVAGNFAPLAQSAQGKIELSAPVARQYAARLAAIADFTREAFPEISREGRTRAKPAIWNERPEFEKRLDDLNTQARALAAVSARADAKPEEFKAAVGAVGNACKNCHDQYREK
jgi:cytochrome c556